MKWKWPWKSLNFLSGSVLEPCDASLQGPVFFFLSFSVSVLLDNMWLPDPPQCSALTCPRCFAVLVWPAAQALVFILLPGLAIPQLRTSPLLVKCTHLSVSCNSQNSSNNTLNSRYNWWVVGRQNLDVVSFVVCFYHKRAAHVHCIWPPCGQEQTKDPYLSVLLGNIVWTIMIDLILAGHTSFPREGLVHSALCAFVCIVWVIRQEACQKENWSTRQREI